MRAATARKAHMAQSGTAADARSRVVASQCTLPEKKQSANTDAHETVWTRSHSM